MERLPAAAEPSGPPACAACGRTVQWGVKPDRDREPVRCGSDDCPPHGMDATDRRLEQAIRDLLAARADDATICPSEAARRVAGDWRPLMEPARRAARRLVAAGEVDVLQHGRVVDPSTARGPLRIRRHRP